MLFVDCHLQDCIKIVSRLYVITRTKTQAGEKRSLGEILVELTKKFFGNVVDFPKGYAGNLLEIDNLLIIADLARLYEDRCTNVTKKLCVHYKRDESKRISERCHHKFKVYCFAAKCLVYTGRLTNLQINVLDDGVLFSKTELWIKSEAKHGNNPLIFPV